MARRARVREIRPLPAQERMLRSPADIAIFGGGAGGGKTFALLLEPLRYVHVPGFTATTFRRTMPELRNPGSLWPMSHDLYRATGGVPNERDAVWTWPTGATVKFAHLQYDHTRYDWDGAQICLLQFDQLEQFSGDQFFYLLSRNRSVCGVRPYVRATCNPVPADDATGGWLRGFLSWWIDDATGLAIPERAGQLRYLRREGDSVVWSDRPGRHAKSVTFVPATLADNPILRERDPGYEANLRALPAWEQERLLGGNWNARPTAGAVFNRAWFRIVAAGPGPGAPRVRYWDKAGTAAGGKYSAGVRLARGPDGAWVVEDVIRGQWSWMERERVIAQTAQADGVAVPIWIEQEPGSGGKESAEATIQRLAGYVVHADRVTGDKITRAGPLAAQAEAGNVYLVRGAWNEDFLRELHAFPDGRYTDQVDAVSGAFNHLALSDTTAPVETVYDLDAVGGFVL